MQINTGLRRQNSDLYDVNVEFTPTFFSEFEVTGFDYNFLRLSENFGILKLTSETYKKGVIDILRLRNLI